MAPNNLTAGGPPLDPAPITIKPRVWPADAVDVLLGLLVIPVQLPVFVLPVAAVWWFTRSIVASDLAALAVFGLWLGFTVWSLRLSPHGLEFVRLWGKPKFLPWSAITDISAAPRREVLLHGWLWPIPPLREMTPTMSALRHFRIRWAGGFCYYPPANAAEFQTHLEAFRPSPPAPP